MLYVSIMCQNTYVFIFIHHHSGIKKV